MALIHSFLIGSIGGMRSMTPLALVADAARRHWLQPNSGAPAWLARGPVSVGAAAIALAELYGDKMKSAPDRTVIPGLLARVATGSLTGAALVKSSERRHGALLGAGAAIASAFITLRLRKSAMSRYGQTRSGLVEDAFTVGSAALVVWLATRR